MNARQLTLMHAHRMACEVSVRVPSGRPEMERWLLVLQYNALNYDEACEIRLVFCTALKVTSCFSPHNAGCVCRDMFGMTCREGSGSRRMLCVALAVLPPQPRRCYGGGKDVRSLDWCAFVNQISALRVWSGGYTKWIALLVLVKPDTDRESQPTAFPSGRTCAC